MDKKETIIVGFILLILLAVGFIVAPLLYPINNNNQNLNRNELYQISQIAQYCQALCIYAKYNLSISNLSNTCLVSENSILYQSWISYPGADNWGCEISDNNLNLCNNSNYIVLDDNCSIINIYYQNKQLNIT
ncbi:MAG: hypothetical protein RXO36_01410 [Candidatus Nanopusillus acidilobi]|jgi:hypothetical protein